MALDRDALEELRAVSDMDAVHVVQHYLYFPLEQGARQVGNILRERGFLVEERLGADGINWLVLAKDRMVPTEAGIGEMRALLEEIAEKNGGEYDGWEAEVQKKET
jgi:hypothetical protein